MNRLYALWVGGALTVATLILAGCAPIRISEEEATAAWEASAHADSGLLAFRNWNSADPAEIPADCAQCHSTPGFLDFHGADGSPAGSVEQAVAVGGTVECEACHNEAIEQIEDVALPSGHVLTRQGDNATCASCHAGRTAGSEVAALVDGARLDVVDPTLRFINVHNNPAIALLHGSTGGAGYEYEGKSYAGRNMHVAGFRTCTDCHQPHRLRVTTRECTTCHLGIRSSVQLVNIRTSSIDYDGDGNTSEGIAKEISTLRSRLIVRMKEYAAERTDAGGLEYRDEYPYFFDSAGQPFSQWTPRLLRTAYNYQVVTLGEGAWAHNAPYAIQLLYDSIEDLQGDLRGAVRPAGAPTR
jgi:hypothetical protein